MNNSFIPPQESECSRAARKSRRGAFSLVEILAAMVIIAVLVVLLFPMAKKMIEKGQQATCMGNLRTLWTGANLFAGDHNGYLPWYIDSGKVQWETAIAPYVGDYEVFGRTSKNWRRSGPFTCPATASKWWLGYGWNYNGLGHSPVPAELAPGKTPSDYTRFGPTKAGSKPHVVMMADSYYASNPVPKGETPPPSYNVLRTPAAGKKDGPPQPHSGGLNTVFVDGHIEWYPADSWYDSTVWQ